MPGAGNWGGIRGTYGGSGGDDNLLDFNGPASLPEWDESGAGDVTQIQPYGPGRYPDVVQPNTLLPYSPGPGEMTHGQLSPPALPGATQPMPSLPVSTVRPTPDPWQTVARMLQGFAAGTAGQQNPVIQLEQQQQALEQRSQALAFNQRLQMAQLEETRRARTNAENQLARQIKNDETNLDFKRFEVQSKIADTAMDSGLKNSDPNTIAGALRIRRDLGFPGPKTDEEIRRLAEDRVQLEVLEKKGASYASQALLGIDSPGMPAEIRKMAETPQGRAMLMSTYKINDPQEHLLKVQKAEADLETVKFEQGIKKEELTLGAKPNLSPVEQARLDSIRAFRGHDSKSDQMRLAQEYVKGGMPLELALPKAARELAQSKDKDSNMDAVVNDVMRQNQGMSRGQAVLVATNAMNESKKGFNELETSLEGMKQIVGQIEDYSRKVHLYDSIIGRGIQQGKSMASSVFGTEYARNVAGLERQLAYLGGVMRQLGEKGVISDRDIARATPLISPSVWTMASAAKDGIKELRTIIARGEGRLEARKQAAFNPGAPAAAPKPPASDPLGLFGEKK